MLWDSSRGPKDTPARLWSVTIWTASWKHRSKWLYGLGCTWTFCLGKSGDSLHRTVLFLDDKASLGNGVQTAPLTYTSGKEWRLMSRVNGVHSRSQPGRKATYSFVHRCLSQNTHLLLVSLKIRQISHTSRILVEVPCFLKWF